jgi:hypothetical protein
MKIENTKGMKEVNNWECGMFMRDFVLQALSKKAYF